MDKFQIIVVVIFMISALVRVVRRNAKNDPGIRQNPALAAKRQRKIQSDIDSFLAEVSDQSADRPASQRLQEPGRIPAKPQQRRNEGQNHPAPHPTDPERNPGSFRHTVITPASRATQLGSVPEQPLGSGITDHVDTYISRHVSEHVDSHVDDFVEADIAESVVSHLGSRPKEIGDLTSSHTDPLTPAARFRKLLKSQNGVRQAILLNEVLTKPRILRR